MKSIIKTIGIQLAIIALLLLALFYGLKIYTGHGEDISVPDISGLTVEQATSKLDDLDLNIEVIDTTDFNSKIPPLSVNWQDPKGNEKIKKGRTIYVKINAKNFAYVRLPKLESRSLSYARSNLKMFNIEVGNVVYEPDYGKDVVLRVEQNGRILREGDKIQKNSKVNLVLGDGSLGYKLPQQYQKDQYEDAAPTIDSIF